MVNSMQMGSRSAMTIRTWILPCLLASLLVSGCGGGSGPPSDRGTDRAAPDLGPPDRGSLKKDKGPKPKPDKGSPPLEDKGAPLDKGPPPKKQHKVAAIQYGSGNAPMVKKACLTDPTPNVCALEHMVAQAAGAGATLVVLPEYGFGWDQKVYEPDPTVGDNPATNPAWPQSLFIPTFAKVAKLHQIYLVIHLTTKAGTSPVIAYNTQVAFDPNGKVVGKHHKFNLWDEEPKTLTAGKDVWAFASPLGKVGLLICADIYGASPLHNKLVKTLKARVIAFSAHWMTAGAPSYPATFAKTHGVYFIAANTTLGPGQGGGVYDPNGKTLAQSTKNTPSIIYATIPSP